MRNLADLDCIPCIGGEPPLSEKEIQELLPLVPGWNLMQEGGLVFLNQSFEFKDFADTLAFTIQVGEIAEGEDHHPAILTEWGKTTIKWWIHHLNGLHRNDFILAARIDSLYQ